MKFVLSPCGTSLLTNQASEDERSLVLKYANKKTREDIPEPDRSKLESLIDNVSELLEQANLQEASKMSAELNGIIRIYNGEITSSNDFHLLLSTDTWLGEETAKLVKSWLERYNLTVVVHRQKDLQTSEILPFQLSLSELVKKLSEEIPGYSKKGYRIIFNLTGGFKSVQGFLQSIANFYADETVYIFETSSELLRIPKLPVKLDFVSVVAEHIDEFRKLSLHLEVELERLKNIPETLLFMIEDQATLSPWGELVWEESKKEIYTKELLPPPINKIRYTDNFKKAVSRLEKDRIALINRRIDQLARYLLEGINPKSLNFKQLQGNQMEPSTHEMNAWPDLDAKRIFGHFEGDVFVLDKIDRHLD